MEARRVYALVSFAARQNGEVGKVLNEFPATPQPPATKDHDDRW
jgi:hypothetical protein